MRFRFLHAADLHLDTPFTRLTDVPEPVAATLRDASLQAFENLIDTALAEQVAFVSSPVTSTTGHERGVRAQLAFRAGCQRLADAGIRSFVAYGNHDPMREGWSAIGSFPDEVTIFGADEVSQVEVRIDDVVGRDGLGHQLRGSSTTENLAERFGPVKGRGFHVRAAARQRRGTGRSPAVQPLHARRPARRWIPLLGARARPPTRPSSATATPWSCTRATCRAGAPSPASRGRRAPCSSTWTEPRRRPPSCRSTWSASSISRWRSTGSASMGSSRSSWMPQPSGSRHRRVVRSSCGRPSAAEATCTTTSPRSTVAPRC